MGNVKSLDLNGVHRIWQEEKTEGETARCSRSGNQYKRYSEKIADDRKGIELQKQYATCKKSLETEQLAKTRGAIVRASVKWTKEGDKSTKYFLSLEQKRAASNTIKQIQSDQGEIFRDPNDILTETKNTLRN